MGNYQMNNLRSQAFVALSICALFSAITVPSLSYAVGEDGTTTGTAVVAGTATGAVAGTATGPAAGTVAGIAAITGEPHHPEHEPLLHEEAAAQPENYVKVVFLNGLPHSWWVPGVKKANEELCDSLKSQCTADGQSCAMWTWGEITDVPSDLYDAGVVAIDHFKKVATRPMEIWGQECSQAYHETIQTSVEDAQGQTDPLEQRLTLLSGKTRACMKVAGKALVQAPVVGFYNAAYGILAVPAQGAWSMIKICLGACGTAIYNVGNPIVSGLRWAQATASSGVASVGVGIANACLPNMPVAPANPNDHLVGNHTDETAPNVISLISGGEAN